MLWHANDNNDSDHRFHAYDDNNVITIVCTMYIDTMICMMMNVS